MHRRRLNRMLKQAGAVVLAAVIVGVIAFTVLKKSVPAWVGTTDTVSMTRSSCRTPDPIELQNKTWISLMPAPTSWKPGKWHNGKVTYDTADRATFVGGDGVKLKLKASSDDGMTTC